MLLKFFTVFWCECISGALQEAQNVVEGEVSMGSQYHFYLENQVCSVFTVYHFYLENSVIWFIWFLHVKKTSTFYSYEPLPPEN